MAQALCNAAVSGDLATVRTLLSQGVSVESRDGDNNWTPLMRAAAWGRVEVVQELLRHHAAVDATNRDGDTALLLASLSGHTDTVRILLAAGADVHVAGWGGETALGVAREGGNTACVALLEAAVATGQGNALFYCCFGFISKKDIYYLYGYS